ncbi:MAG: hypothetical protein KF765_13370 [Parvibaculaceae bacterium]|nr:hypothetical protein [Parvibaculaceae bacterium]
MSKEKNRIIDYLFSGQESKLLNIKLFRGDADIVTEAELVNESHAAIMQKHVGSIQGSPNAPRSKKPVVDVRALVADM